MMDFQKTVTNAVAQIVVMNYTEMEAKVLFYQTSVRGEIGSG